MQSWNCECGAPLFFTTRRCSQCRRAAVYIPDSNIVRNRTAADICCTNRALGCNWTADVAGGMCFSCGLTRIIPPQNSAANRQARRRFERAKRHLISSLMRLKLLPRYVRGPHGRLEINLLQDKRDNELVAEDFVYTGHCNGLISINAREADPFAAEKMRMQMNEKYRTLLGSLRHETGHYFWQALVETNESRLQKFREIFGDERADYEAAKGRYYAAKPGEHPAFVSEYARMHPHEDWAETWAHYLHMESAVAVAARAGMVFSHGGEDFAGLLPRWRQVVLVANALSAALGHRPSFPFDFAEETAPKLGFIHDLLRQEKSNG